MSVDPAVSALIARELFEGAMFITTHVGVVVKNTILTDEEKRSYLNQLYIGIASGLLIGVVISIAVGFSLAAALNQIDRADYGVEIGEGLSKVIAAIFVIDLCFKIPKWFEISNYVPSEDERIQVSNKVFLSSSLFWNILRETCEAGILTGITVLLSETDAGSTVGASVGVGIFCAIVGGGAIALGARYLNKYFFALLATVIIMMLATGLMVGATGSFEEAHKIDTGKESEILYETEGDTKSILRAMKWCGIRNEVTVATLVVWVITVVGLCSAQIWNNYLGYDFVPKHFTEKFCNCFSARERAKTNVVSLV